MPSSVRNFISGRLSYIPFRKCLILNKPYFGNYLLAGQTWPTRKDAMKKLLENEILKYNNKDYKILEIGSWGGSSTILWASVCKKFHKGKVFCIDTWRASENAPKAMKEAVKKDKIIKLFLHNIITSGLKEFVIPIRGTSDEIAEILKFNTFDFIYIDGDHSYSQFKRDLVNYSKLCKEGGIICGDDLEINTSEIDLDNAKKHCEEDYIKDTNAGKMFHPGIALGIREFFGEVNMINGFWATRKSKKGWEKLILSD